MASRPARSEAGGHRRNHSKVKSGCITCKIRRIKCDETKPSCLKCTSTLRKCDGYKGKEALKFVINTSKTDAVKSLHQDPASARATEHTSKLLHSKLIGSPHNPLLDFSGTILEHRSLDFFLHEAAPALSGYFDVDFWGILLPRVGYFEPPVQHAMIALGSLYEYSKCKDGYPNLMQQRYALIQYNKAIRALKSYNMEDPKTLEITMLTCLLFVCLELLRGNPEQALNHLDNGLSILRNSQRARERTSSLNQQHKDHLGKVPPNTISVTETLSDTFSRLSIQKSLCSRRKPDIYPSTKWSIVENHQSARLPFANLRAARLSLMEIFIQCLQPVGIPEASSLSSNVDTNTNTNTTLDRELLTAQLHYWNSRLGLYVTDSLPQLTPLEIKGAHTLRLLSIIATIWNTTTSTSSECAYDAHFAQHRTVLALSLTFIDQHNTEASPTTSTTTATTAATSTDPASPSSSTSTSTLPSRATTPPPPPAARAPASHPFTFEMGVIPALYFTALKCRHPTLRRSAIDALRRVTPQREGFWDARLLAAIAARVVQIEEAGGDCTGEGGGLPAEARRVHGVYITPRAGGGEEGEMAVAGRSGEGEEKDRQGMRWQDVVFTWRSGGEEWEQVMERVVY